VFLLLLQIRGSLSLRFQLGLSLLLLRIRYSLSLQFLGIQQQQPFFNAVGGGWEGGCDRRGFGQGNFFCYLILLMFERGRTGGDW
jgi:hypothetical protein